jgi:SAM-dependent methyltransferase
MTTSTDEIQLNDNSYRLSIDYESDYGNHSEKLYIQQKNLETVIKTLPAAISNDLNTFDDEQPLRLFDEVARLLRPEGRFIISFSNRWFPTKAIQVWNNLHDFERIGLVMEYFIESAHFGEINTYSLRGRPRPVDDKHNVPLPDPVYVVWAN